MRSKIIRLDQRRSASSVPVPSPRARQASLPTERAELRSTYEELKQDLIKHPNRMVFIKDFGPALFHEEVKTPKYQQLVFRNYFNPKLKTTITPYNFGKILINVSEASPELQFSLAYSEILVGGLTVASKREGWSHEPSGMLGAVSERANFFEATRLRDEATLDPYTFTREAYRQRRLNDFYDGDPPLEDFEEGDEGESRGR